MNFWMVLIGLVWVFGVGMIAWIVFYAVTASKRHDLEAAADMEYAEMEAQRRLLSESTVSFSRRSGGLSDVEIQKMNRLSTDVGREILKLDSIGRLVFISGAFVAVVVLIVYLKLN